ncbi:hypothetical protein LZ30DRAFT_207404 [Colletotrichum cereale]|nr:hypothetical protein LZ30DRAFT_207404 [Colletotrichum cereale]
MRLIKLTFAGHKTPLSSFPVSLANPNGRIPFCTCRHHESLVKITGLGPTYTYYGTRSNLGQDARGQLLKRSARESSRSAPPQPPAFRVLHWDRTHHHYGHRNLSYFGLQGRHVFSRFDSAPPAQVPSIFKARGTASLTTIDLGDQQPRGGDDVAVDANFHRTCYSGSGAKVLCVFFAAFDSIGQPAELSNNSRVPCLLRGLA